MSPLEGPLAAAVNRICFLLKDQFASMCLGDYDSAILDLYAVSTLPDRLSVSFTCRFNDLAQQTVFILKHTVTRRMPGLGRARGRHYSHEVEQQYAEF